MQIAAEYEYCIPASLPEAVALVADGATVMAGGSDLMPRLKLGVASPVRMADIARVPGLAGIRGETDGLHIGAMTTLSAIATDETILRLAPALTKAARNVASPQIRTRGTVAGNLLQARRCFYFNQPASWRDGIPVCRKLGGDVCLQVKSSPVCRAIYYSDLAPALIALRAEAVLWTAEGERRMPVEDLVKAHCTDTLGPVLVTELTVPAGSLAEAGTVALFRKYSLRGGIDFPIINFACAVHPDGGVDFLVGAIAPEVVRLEKVEAYLQAERGGFDPETAISMAVEEMGEKGRLIREAGLSIPVKRNAFLQVRGILTALKKQF